MTYKLVKWNDKETVYAVLETERLTKKNFDLLLEFGRYVVFENLESWVSVINGNNVFLAEVMNCGDDIAVCIGQSVCQTVGQSYFRFMNIEEMKR